jgi:two-component system, OmpR family, sensor histidine kinase KdpD
MPLPQTQTPSAASAAGPAGWWLRHGRGLAGAGVLCAAAALGAALLDGVLDAAGLVLIFLLAVVLAAARFGRGPGVAAAGLAVLLFNLLFVPPRLSLAVADPRMLFTFAVMLVVGLLVGQLTAGLRAQAEAAREREQRVRSLYEISRELGMALTVERIAEALDRFAAAQLGGRAVLWTRGDDGRLQPVAAAPDEALAAAAQEAFDRARATDAAGPTRLLPLRSTMALRGVVAFRRHGARAWGDEDGPLLEACAALAAAALERVHYIAVAQAHALEVADERLRNSVLSAVSHDLRTPLAGLVGLAGSLALTRPPLAPEQAGIANAIAASARRMAALVDQLLDMARMQAGAVKLDLQWQPVDEVVGSALAASAAALEGRPMQVQLPGSLPLVHIDAVLMERVLVNLLENVAKHTPAGTAVAITARAADAAPAEGAGQQLWLELRDHGPGLPAGRADRLFRKFERGWPESSMPGVGLGLALVRAIVDAHGGRIEALDAPGGGACFRLRLPAGAPPATMPPVPGPATPPPPLPPTP